MPITSRLDPRSPASPRSSRVPYRHAFHGGRSFEAIGIGLDHLERAEDVISADVLDAWFDPSPRVLQKIRDFLPFLARTSPPVHAAGLLQTIASQRGIAQDCLLAGGGSSDLIFACLPHLIHPSGRALLLDPMYGEYQHLLKTVMGIEVAQVALSKTNEFVVETDAIVAAVQTLRPDLVILVNPNSPTGQHWPRSQVIYFLENIPDSVTVVVDETYIEYVGSHESVEHEACQRPNLLVIKSMSKVYALSGMRVGYLVAHASIIRRLAVWIPPWSVSLPAQLAAIEALRDPHYYAECYRQTALLRDEFRLQLNLNLQLRTYLSKTNFLLVETSSSARKIVDALSSLNVFVRNCDSMSDQLEDRFIRITVKKQSENQRIAEALETITKNTP